MLSGLLYSAARFVPVPLLDDWMRNRITRSMLVRAVEGVPQETLEPLSSPAEGCVTGCLKIAFWFPLSLLLFPIRKILNIVFAVRNVSRDLVEMVLLGRLAERAVEMGLIGGEAPVEKQRRNATDLRAALDHVMRDSGRDILGAGLQATIGPVAGLMRAGLGRLRGMRHADQAAAPDPALVEGTGRVERAFDRPEVRALIEKLEARIELEFEKRHATIVD